MNKQKFEDNGNLVSEYPLGVGRLKEMQDDYGMIAAALAGVKDPANMMETKFIVSGCASRGAAGFISWDGELMEVESDSDPTHTCLDVVETSESVTVEGNATVVRVKRVLNYVTPTTLGGGIYTGIYWNDLKTLDVRLRSRNVASAALTGTTDYTVTVNTVGSAGGRMRIHFEGTRSAISLPAVPLAMPYGLLSPFSSAYQRLIPYLKYGNNTCTAGICVIDTDGTLRFDTEPGIGDRVVIDTLVDYDR